MFCKLSSLVGANFVCLGKIFSDFGEIDTVSGAYSAAGAKGGINKKSGFYLSTVDFPDLRPPMTLAVVPLSFAIVPTIERFNPSRLSDSIRSAYRHWEQLVA